MRTKQELRKQLQEVRLAISPMQLEKNQDLLLIRFQQLNIPFIQSIHTYVPIVEHNEPDPDPLVRWLQFRNPGVKVVVPKLISQQHLMHVEINDDTEWNINAWGIPEPVSGNETNPQDLDLIFVPLLGFDKQGNRIGYGKGFYDLFLKECRPDAIKIGISVLPPIEDSFLVDPWDVALDYCLTPEEIYAFT